MQIKRITLNSHVTFDFFHFEKQDDSNVNIYTSRYIPKLSANSSALITFDDGKEDIYSCDGITSSSLGYTFSIFREQAGSSSLDFIARLSSGDLSVIDHNVRSNATYTYYIYKEDENYMSNASLTEPVTPIWCDWSITGIYQPDESVDNKLYKVDKDYIWKLSLNLESGTYNHVMNKTVYDGMSRYPKISNSKSGYETGTLTCLLGRIVDGEILTTPYETETWNFFCNTNEKKLLKDRKGRSWIVDIIETSNEIDDLSNAQYGTITFNWVEIDQSYDYSITE